MKDIRRLWLGCFIRVRRRLFVICEPSERLSIWIDIPGRLGNSGKVWVVLEYGGEI
jgi:hypothetical protein